VACWLRLGCWSNNLRIANLALVHSTAEYCALVWCRSAHTRLIDPTINDALRTGCLRPTPAYNLRILAGIQPAELRRIGATLSPACRAMEPGHLLQSTLTFHRVQMHGASNRDTHLYPSHNISAVPLTITTYVRRSGRITNGMRSERTISQDYAFSSPTPAPPRNDPPKKSLGGLTTSAPASGVSAHVCTNEVRPPLRPVSVAQKNKPSTMLPSMSNPSTSSWTTWPDGSGRYDNRMAAAQQLRRDLVRPSSPI